MLCGDAPDSPAAENGSQNHALQVSDLSVGKAKNLQYLKLMLVCALDYLGYIQKFVLCRLNLLEFRKHCYKLERERKLIFQKILNFCFGSAY